MSLPPKLLELRHIIQTYGTDAHRFVALQDVSLRLHEGEFVALLGPSGCGKSTLLRLITGLQQPTEGQVFYRDQPLQGVNPHATIVFQTFALFPWLTVQHNVEVALQARGVPATQRAAQAVDLLDKVGLDGFETAFPRELSGGMRQKVGFARALAVEPELLCLDEPFSALDVLSAESLRGELHELWSSGTLPIKAILMVTHNIEEATLLADRIVVMDRGPGRVVAEVKVGLPHPRQRKEAPFLEVVDQVYAILAKLAGQWRYAVLASLVLSLGLLEAPCRLYRLRMHSALATSEPHFLSPASASDCLGDPGDYTPQSQSRPDRFLDRCSSTSSR